MKVETIQKINEGELDGESTLDFALSHAEKVKEDILQSWFKKGANRNDKALNEFLLIEIIRNILGAEPRGFFVLLSVSRRLRALLDLKYVDDLERYKYFKRKIKNLKGRLREISKRSLGTEGDESFAFDSSIVTADLNGYRNGKKIKKGEYDARFTYSTTKGTVIGFQTLLLFNLEKFSVRKFEIYPIDASTKKMWKEMVCDEIGTKGGKKKTVIADGGFFAYENYIQSANHRVESIINPRCDCRENLKEKLENMSPRLELFEIHDPEKKEKVMSEMKDLVEH
ncbi:hypothetical protein AKJ40_04160 [candidate division MSBL1 archaeon SCGC-AAA259M10]|uniref:Transposase IS4-like domain-containing protein n=1 Tax=candidate division MSBL1 archaeon SCGC-AAA259M10 TaxID=1698270 RepID=A0A133UXW2_9EURY|nr:hypothetical protein AKJ40_04160 [candidate division MSBL1 archaeon SCGC-AAA259M10]